MAKVIIGNKYKHFKGNIYEVIAIAKDTDTGKEKVIYKDLSNNGKVWCRDKDEFEGYKICLDIYGDEWVVSRFKDITEEYNYDRFKQD